MKILLLRYIYICFQKLDDSIYEIFLKNVLPKRNFIKDLKEHDFLTGSAQKYPR